MKISVVLPIYLPSDKHLEMTKECIRIAKSTTKIPIEWVIVETGSKYFIEDADIYIYEKTKTTPNESINRGFRSCNGDYVIFLANDVFVADGWVENMLECFNKHEDCGIASLGNNEFKQEKSDKIIERIYFSVCMFKMEDAYLDPFYDNLFDDSDMIMRIYSQGKKCYQNLNTIVFHDRHSTYGVNDLSSPKNVRQKEYFNKKWEFYKNYRVFNLLK